MKSVSMGTDTEDVFAVMLGSVQAEIKFLSQYGLVSRGQLMLAQTGSSTVCMTRQSLLVSPWSLVARLLVEEAVDQWPSSDPWSIDERSNYV